MKIDRSSGAKSKRERERVIVALQTYVPYCFEVDEECFAMGPFPVSIPVATFSNELEN